MHIITVGFNHHTTPIALREQFTFSEKSLSMAVSHLRNMKSILEAVIVSTCNRTELYVVCDQLHTGKYYSKAFLESWFRIPRAEFQEYLHIEKNEQAIRHLFHVISGLDSLVVGETQILGQIKKAFLTAQEASATGTIFHQLFKQAITFGKKVHAETEIGANAVSVGYAAVELAQKMFNQSQHKKVVLLGAGKMGELTAKHFSDHKQTEMLVLNRTFERAQRLAKEFKGTAHEWDELPQVLREADIVISSTGSPTPILTKQMVEPTLEERQTPLFFIDIALPRDVDPAVHELEQVFLYNIDDLKDIVDTNKSLREKEANKVTAWIDYEVNTFQEWVHMLGVVPLIQALREKALTIQDEVMQRIERKLPELTEKEKRVLKKQTKSIVNQLLRDPIVRIKELSTAPNQDEIFTLFVQLFALEEYINQEEVEQKDKLSAMSLSFKEIYS